MDVKQGSASLVGTLAQLPDDGKITYVAAAPADSRASFVGSGLPFANKEQAFFETPNKGTVPVDRAGRFSVSLQTPASYYVGLGTVLVRPTIFLSFRVQSHDVVTHVPVANPIAFRFGTYPMSFDKRRDTPEFYSLGVETLPRTQEQILRDSAYPLDNVMPPNFWGTKPPV